jgi:cyclic pyranopterin phosphate synthase
MATQLTDTFARKFFYLRLSITDVCNFRCTYCLPNGYKPGGVTNKGFLSLEEIRRVTRAFSAMGTEKVRLTGGEPSLRRDFTDIIAAVRENHAIRQIAVTTNGYRLARDVAHWRDAGLTAINVSVDSLDARQFFAITGQDKFKQVMDGIDAAFAAGFEKVKVNTVLMRDVNHHQLDTFLSWIQPRPIQLRFIELMETGEGSDLFRKHHISGDVLRVSCLNAAGSRSCAAAVTARHRFSAIRTMPARLVSSCPMKKTFAPVVTGCGSLPSESCIYACLAMGA